MMKTKLLFVPFIGLFLLMLVIACQKEDYTMGELKIPTNLVINTEIVGKNATNPNGDGSGDIKVTASATDALAFQVNYGSSSSSSFVPLKNGSGTYKYTNLGIHTYTVTVTAYGSGGTATTATKTVTVRFDFKPEESIVNNLTGTGSKAWIVDKSVPGHFGVGPWSSRGPDWWQAAINEKVNCCPCFYTSVFTFIKSGNNYQLKVECPDGVFTKTGALASIPGIPASGDEGCYSYGGGINSIGFLPTPATNTGSTNTIIKLGGSDIFIGYGSLQDEYEILSISDTEMKLRVRGTETGNAWYLTLKPQS